MNKEEFDRLFDDTFDKMATTTQEKYLSDYHPSWEIIKKRIKAEEKKRAMRKTFRNVSVIAASMLLGAIILGSTPITKAFHPFYQTLKELPGEIVTLFFGNQDKTDNSAKTNPPTVGKQGEDSIGETTVISVTLEEAKEKVSFELPLFNYIPAGYELKNIELFLLQGEELSKKARLTFKNENRTFWVTLNELNTDTTVGSGAKNAKIEEIQLNFGKGYFTVSDDGSSKLEFLKGNIYVIILGQLEKEELIRFVESM